VLSVFVRLFVASCVVAGVGAGPAAANHGPLPWVGGYGYTSAYEQKASAIATELAERTATVYCNSPEEWAVQGASRGFDPARVAGFVPRDPTSPTGTASYTHLAPSTCYYADEFAGAPQRAGQKECQTGTRTEYRTEYRSESRSQRYSVKVRKRVRVSGHLVWRTVRVWRTRIVEVQVPYQVPYQVPILGICADYLRTIDSIETLAHESQHIYGVVDEAAAECFGLQFLTVAANRLGAPAAFAYEIGRDYLPIYAAARTAAPAYWSADCYDGGRLDLWPGTAGWPYPTSTTLLSVAQFGKQLTRAASIASVPASTRAFYPSLSTADE
jgi:hypothetical protein